MRELRTCPATGVTVLLNDAWPDRAREPAAVPASCWACGAPGPVIANHGGLVVVPHPVPALGIEGDVRTRVAPQGVRRDAVGAHELIFGDHAEAAPGLLLLAAQRVADLRRDRRFRGFHCFRLHAPAWHPVWQLLALPVDVAPSHPAPWRDAERDAGVRVVAEVAGAIAIAAWAPRVPFETWVIPAHGEAEFPEGFEAVAALAEWVLGRMGEVLGGPEIAITVEEGTPWRLVLRPNVSVALPTLAVGLPGHGVFPERAAAELRE